MRTNIISYLFIVGLISLTMFACTVDDGDSKITPNQSSFLDNTAELIFSSYQTFNSSVNELNNSIDSLSIRPNSTTLSEARKNLKTAYLNWQQVSFYEFGPAKTASLKSSLNVFKTDTTQILANITSGNYNLDQISMKDAKGFPALDYLLHAKSDTAILNQLISNGNTRDYLKAISNDIKVKVNQVVNGWNTYKNDFKTAMGTDIGSSTGILINSLNLHFEQFFRDNKIGIPLGIRSSGIPRPDFVEAIYGQYSVELAVENLKAMKTLYLGGSGSGLDDYLIASEASELNTRILSQIQLIEMKLNILSDPLTQQIQTNSTQVKEAYDEMQKLIVLWKVDMPSRLGVLITYQDNDGD
ncbi:MAG: imelysin family protein [Flavobacteriales bacterium]|nr:imelysin family protein [Flavobacteriales bacterium]